MIAGEGEKNDALFGSWNEYLTSRFLTMYAKREQCDLKILCNAETFLVHRLVMSASSEYVRKLDDEQSIINLPDEISAKTLRNIINFVYTGNTSFLKEDVNDLLIAASYLDMQIVIKFIERENPLICGQLINFEDGSVPRSGLPHSGRSVYGGEYPSFCLNAELHSIFSLPNVGNTERYDSPYFAGRTVQPASSLEFPQSNRPTEFSCPICLKSFATTMGLWQHSKIHEPKNQFTCDICKSEFRYKGNMARHIEAVHMKEFLERNFHCDICDKSFVFKLELKQHSKVHGSKNHYECPHCSEKFRWKTSLNKHVSAYH